jgi:hypothetical protein
MHRSFIIAIDKMTASTASSIEKQPSTKLPLAEVTGKKYLSC